MDGAVITNPVELLLKPKTGGQVDSVTELSWCLTPEAAAVLKRQRITNALLLVIVLDAVGSEMSRDVFPLFDLKGWLQFYRPGENLVLATVVYHPSKEPREIKKSLLDKNRRWTSYVTHNIRHDELRELGGVSCLDGQAELRVVVPPTMFAKEPPAWMRWYVRFIYGTFLERKPTFKDECDFRRKFLKAVFPGGPLMILLLVFGSVFAVLRTVVALAIIVWLNLAGKRRVNYGALLKPMQNIREVWASTTSSIWVTKKNGQRRLPIFWIVNPLTAVILVAATLVASRIFGVGWWALVSYLAPVFGGVSLGILLGSLLGVLVDHLQGRRQHDNKRLQRQQVKQERRRREFSENIDALVCAGKGADVKIPSRKPTRVMVLKYYGIKAQVCKPFVR